MRPSRDEILLRHAELEAERSTCSRNHVGVVFALEGRVLITGFNGAPKGLPHCNHSCDCELDNPPKHELIIVEDAHYKECNSLLPCTISVHAEANAIAFAARNGVRLEGSDCYCSLTPCLYCAHLLVNVGIKRLIYGREYRDHAGLHLLSSAGIVIIG